MPDRNNGFVLRRPSLNTAVLAAIILTLIASSAVAQNSINTIPSWDGTNFLSEFGVIDTATYGQTISVGAGSSPLQSFTFQIGFCGPQPVTLRGEVYAWDGTNNRATGPALFESAPQSVPAANGYTAVTFNAGGVNLSAGTYVLFASTSRDQAGAPASLCRWGALTNNTTYAGGQFVYINNGPNPGQWTTNNWSPLPVDLAFAVNGLGPGGSGSGASGAPAASTTSLLIGVLALIGLGLFRLSRHNQSA